MAGRVGKELERWGRDIESGAEKFGKGYKKYTGWNEAKKAWDRGRESLGLKQPDVPEPPPAAPPAAQQVAGLTQTEQYNKLKGRSKTRVVGRTRSPLGGGATLT